MKTELLIEILTEELPAIPFLKEWKNIPTKWKQALQKQHIDAECEIYFTPRRICIFARDFPLQTQDIVSEFFGPPLQIGYIDGDRLKGLSQAGIGFLKKANITKEHLTTITKDNKEVLYAKRILSGVPSKQIIVEVVVEFLDSLQFGKSMRWGSNQKSFIRPIRNILILLDKTHITTKAFGQQGYAATLLHRDFGGEWVQISSLDCYLKSLQNGGIILDYEQRKSLILSQIQHIEQQHHIKVEIDQNLLDEIGAITEYPTALLGHFDKQFLSLPKEVIITSMKENQRYFGVYQKHHKHDSQNNCQNDCLYNGFIVVANSTTKDFSQIISGNERVLKARLSDAMFFYQNDIKTPLQSAPLAKIAFVDELGSMLDKVRREQAIGAYLAQKYNQNLDFITKALEFAKSDLLSEMVGEFPELQGIMGYYYMLAQHNDAPLALAIKEQYLPNSEHSALPSNVANAIVAMSIKLDNLLSLFSIGKIPNGSKDPFALRRAANGLLKIILEFNLEFDLDSDLQILTQGAPNTPNTPNQNLNGAKNSASVYKAFDIDLLRSFLLERLESILKLNALLFRSVAKSDTKEILRLCSNAKALELLLDRSDREQLISVFKRVANITKDMSKDTDISIDEKLLSAPQEKFLYEALKGIWALDSLDSLDSTSFLERLFELRLPLEAFFEYVMVNDENLNIRKNRKALIFAIYLEFKKIGDLKELAI